MSQSLLILGRQPALGIAEAESLFGADKITPLGDQAVLIDVPAQDIPFSRIGGATRAAKLLTFLPYTEWDKIEQYLVEELPKHTCCLPEGKVRLGLSLYGFNLNVRRLNASGLTLKKAVKNDGRSVRVVPNSASELNTAQVLHNQLTGPTGIEMILIRDGNRTVLAQTTAVQDIDAYAARDQARPARDARVGMLPPKLAQIIINLASGRLEQEDGKKEVLDPFCGTGVLLQEALLMGYDVIGTDLEPRMIEYSQTNLAWLSAKFQILSSKFQLAVGDATDHQWLASALTSRIIAGETYLGRPFASEPRPDVLNEVMRDVDTIHRKFLKNVAQQTKPGFRLCIAVPAWKTSTSAHHNSRNQTDDFRPGSAPSSLNIPKGMSRSPETALKQKSSSPGHASYGTQGSDGFKHLKTLDNLDELGYTRMSFVHADTRDLIYYRDNQVVGRELVILIRK
jgi:tRNA G10  N-methylase Trm11